MTIRCFVGYAVASEELVQAAVRFKIVQNTVHLYVCIEDLELEGIGVMPCENPIPSV
jgi:hypothetical protein